jgi:alpha/beta hydrolase fold
MTKLISRGGVSALIAGIAFLTIAIDSSGQQPAGEVSRIETVDGLNLWGKWFQGGKGNKSDTVIMVHAYGKECSKGSQWEDLAKALQKEDFSVLMFDLRGHGESAKNLALNDWKKFCGEPYNKHSGYVLNPNANTQEIKRERFSANYYPYLINDLAAVRRFIDKKNDSGNCNSGRIFIIAEGSICPLIMMATSTEFLRNGAYPAVVMANAAEHPAGKDIAGLIFLSWANSTGPGHAATLNLMNVAWKRPELWQESKPNPTLVAERMKDNVAMSFVYSKDDKNSEAEMRKWFNRFAIQAKMKEDRQLRKYTFELAAAKLAGINLMDVMVDEKVKKTVNGKEVEETIKVPAVQQYIVGFIKATVENGKNGGIHLKRNIDNHKPEAVPLHRLNASLP